MLQDDFNEINDDMAPEPNDGWASPGCLRLVS